MRLITKKNIAASLGLILAVAIITWYFSPILKYKYLCYKTILVCKYRNAQFVSITDLKNPPQDWNKIVIGNLSMKLPMSEVTKIRGIANSVLFFKFNKASLAIYDIVPPKEFQKKIEETKIPYPFVAYQDYLAIFKSTSNDISFFNSRNKNSTTLQNLILKTISAPKGGLDKIISIQSKGLKALCLISGKYENSYSASVYVYSQNEKQAIHLFLKGHTNSSDLESALLTFLGGLNIPNQPNDRDRVKKDINSLANNFNKT